MCRRTFQANLIGGVQSDCPGRERLGYGGDIVSTYEAHMLNWDMRAIYLKILQDFADEASDDYVATVLHPEGDALVIDRQIYGLVDWDAEADAFISYENTGLFGSNSGTRHYYGDAFEPDTEWLTCWMPSEEYLKEYRQNLFEGGYLLHLVRDLPCTVDGQPAILTAGNCILLVRYHESLTQAEVRTEDGSVYAMINIDFDPDDWQYRIDGVDQDEYFDNLFYAD